MSTIYEDSRKNYNDYLIIHDNSVDSEQNINSKLENYYDFEYENYINQQNNLYDISIDINFDIQEYIKNIGLEIGQYLNSNVIYDFLNFYM